MEKIIINTSNGKITMEKKLLENKILLNLSNMGFSESYYATRYLSEILFHMIELDDDSLKTYLTIIDNLVEEYNLNQKSLVATLGRLMKKCNDPRITSKVQFQLKRNSTLNKIRVMRAEILLSLSQVG